MSVDILFQYFFQPDYAIISTSLENDLRLDIGSGFQPEFSSRQNIGSAQDSGQDLRFPVSVSLELDADSAFTVQQVSLSSLRLRVEKCGWTDSGLDLVLSASDVAGDYQMMMIVREEDRFTN